MGPTLYLAAAGLPKATKNKTTIVHPQLDFGKDFPNICQLLNHLKSHLFVHTYMLEVQLLSGTFPLSRIFFVVVQSHSTADQDDVI